MEARKSCAFDTLFTKHVPHIIEKIFLSLDYESFKSCCQASNAWKKVLTSKPFKGKAKLVFHDEILKDQKKLYDTVGRPHAVLGNAEEVRRLLSTGMLDVNCKTDIATWYWPRLTITKAAFHGYHDSVQVLIDAGADCNKCDDDDGTTLFYATSAVRRDKGDVVKLLLKGGADPNKESKKHGETPLMRAAGRGSTETVKLLLNAGADVNKSDKSGRTPLHWAVLYGRKDMAKLLVASGAHCK